ncbi:MAG: Flp pilus assembly protein CpaB [Steroidobacteraceae bacterium]|jgi:pilus assembly protein CpaB
MKRPIVFVLLAGVGAVLAAIVVFSAIRNRESEVQRAMAHTVEVVVAARDIPLGEKLEPDAVKLVRWARDGVPEGAFTDPQAVAGSFARSEFMANEPVVAGKLFMGEKTSGVMPLLIPAGMRAMSVPVDEVADISGFVAPHTRVDILVAVSGTGPGDGSFSRIVLQNIEVLAVAQEIEHVKDAPEVVKVVTLLVTPTDAEKLTLASHEGMLRLAMRNYSDSTIVATNGIAVGELLHAGGPALPVMQPAPAAAPAARRARGPTALPVEVEVMRNGKSSEEVTFVNSGVGARSSVEVNQDAPATSAPPLPAAPGLTDTPESPVSAAKPASSASLAGSTASAFAAPLRPEEPDYVAAPKSYEVQ